MVEVICTRKCSRWLCFRQCFLLEDTHPKGEHVCKKHWVPFLAAHNVPWTVGYLEMLAVTAIIVAVAVLLVTIVSSLLRFRGA